MTTRAPAVLKIASGSGCTNENTWTDVKSNLVCGTCKVLVGNMNANSNYRTCSAYCTAIGRICTGAWEENNNDCTVKSTEDCQHNFGSYTSDAICECGDKVEPSGCQKMMVDE